MPKRKPSSNPITDHFKSQRYTHNQLSGLGDSMARGHYFNMVDRTQRWLNRTENQVNALYSQNKLPSGCYHSSSTGSSTSCYVPLYMSHFVSTYLRWDKQKNPTLLRG